MPARAGIACVGRVWTEVNLTRNDDKADSEARAAAALSKLGASKGGGTARARRLSAEERSSSARRAAEVRWGKTVVDATHIGELVIGDKRIECAVLEDGNRVISQGTVLTALGRAPSMGRPGNHGGSRTVNQCSEPSPIRRP